jgi:membrane protein YqaA with SNARE-associated domain
MDNVAFQSWHAQIRAGLAPGPRRQPRQHARLGRQLGAGAAAGAVRAPALVPGPARATIARAKAWYHRYGRWSLLLSWLPVIGDPLTIVAGVLREPLPVFLLLVAVAKTARYLAVVAIAQGWM